jgi:hypothetical protein
MLDTLKGSDFTGHLGQQFCVQLDGMELINLELVSAQEFGEAASGQRRPFSLLFLGPESTRYLLQHTYRLRHVAMGELDVFIVPIGPDGKRMRYEAIFS